MNENQMTSTTSNTPTSMGFLAMLDRLIDAIIAPESISMKSIADHNATRRALVKCGLLGLYS